MQYIEFTGEQLFSILLPDELNEDQLKASGVVSQTIVRANQHGDLEMRRRNGWEVVGGLLGDFEKRVVDVTGLDWAPMSADD